MWKCFAVLGLVVSYPWCTVVFSNLPVSRALICKLKPFSCFSAQFTPKALFSPLLPKFFSIFNLLRIDRGRDVMPFCTHPMRRVHQVSVMALTEMLDQYPWKVRVWLGRQILPAGWITAASTETWILVSLFSWQWAGGGRKRTVCSGVSDQTRQGDKTVQKDLPQM